MPQVKMILTRITALGELGEQGGKGGGGAVVDAGFEEEGFI
jgi:hypothetical protein